AVRAAAWARAAGVAHVMTFDAAGDGYTIAGGADGAGGARMEVSLGAEPYVCDVQSVTLSEGGSKLVFDGYGRPQSGASVTLAVGDRSRTIVLSETIIRPEPAEVPDEEDADDNDEPIDLFDLPGELIGGLLGGLGG
ncbi:MAG: hypothetical protein ACIARR_09735, partial [Phycisphaerales bacterium JB059]